MVDLAIKPQEIKDQMTGFYRARIDALGQVFNLLNVDIVKVLFSSISEEKIPNKDKILEEIKANLAASKKEGMAFLNDLEPNYTDVPQAYINFASQWKNYLPTISELLEKEDTPQHRQSLSQYMQKSISKGDEQIALIQPLLTQGQQMAASFSQHSTEFSDRNQAFKTLETIDEENLKAAKAVIDKLTALIASLSDEIDVDLIAADKDLSIASTVMKYGSKGGVYGKALGVSIAVVFILMANTKIQEAIALIDQEFADAQKEAKYELLMTTINEQLVSLHQTQTALQNMNSRMQTFNTEMNDVIGFFEKMNLKFNQVVTDLQDPDMPMSDILSEFDLGETKAQWDEIIRFATKMQTLDIYIQKSHVLTTKDPQTADQV